LTSVNHAEHLRGLTGEPFQLVVEEGKVREFARATRATHPAYLEEARPVIPPTFLASAALWAPNELALLDRAGFDVTRTLHAAQEYRFPAGPPRAGTRLNALPRVETTYEREGRRGGTLRFVVLATEFRDERGELVAESRMTVVEPERAPESP
jgi:hypothetical protein